MAFAIGKFVPARWFLSASSWPVLSDLRAVHPGVLGTIARLHGFSVLRFIRYIPTSCHRGGHGFLRIGATADAAQDGSARRAQVRGGFDHPDGYSSISTGRRSI